jgi:hypothetical protein
VNVEDRAGDSGHGITYVPSSTTAFGGSRKSVATPSAWCVVYVNRVRRQ